MYLYYSSNQPWLTKVLFPCWECMLLLWAICRALLFPRKRRNWPLKNKSTVKDGIAHQRPLLDWHSAFRRQRNLSVWQEPSWRRSRLHGGTCLSPHNHFNPPPKQCKYVEATKKKNQQTRRKDWTCFLPQNTAEHRLSDRFVNSDNIISIWNM